MMEFDECKNKRLCAANAKLKPEDWYKLGWNDSRANQWVDVKDRLPPWDERDYLIKHIRGGILIEEGNTINAMEIARQHSDDPEQHRITHWMPIPEQKNESIQD